MRNSQRSDSLPCRRRCSDWPLPSFWRWFRRWSPRWSSTGVVTARIRAGGQPAGRPDRACQRRQSTRASCRPRTSNCTTSTSARPAGRRRCGPTPSSLNSGSVRCCAAKCGPPNCISITPQINLRPRPLRSDRLAGAVVVVRPDALTISRLKSRTAASRLADAASGVAPCCRSFRSTATSAPSSDRSTVKEPSSSATSLFGYRISGSRVDEDGGLKVKLGVDPSNHPLTTEIDGILRFDRGVPQFDGTLALTRPVGVTLARGERVMSDPWQLAGKVRATPASASLHDLALQYGPEERAVNFTGKAELTFGAASASRRRALGAAGRRRPHAGGSRRDPPAAIRHAQEFPRSVCRRGAARRCRSPSPSPSMR